MPEQEIDLSRRQSLVNRLNILLKKTDLNQRQFAIKIDISQPYCSQIFSCKKYPSNKVFFMIEQKLNVNKEWLREGKGEIFKDPDLPLLRLKINQKLETLNKDQLEAVLAFIDIYTTDKKK